MSSSLYPLPFSSCLLISSSDGWLPLVTQLAGQLHPADFWCPTELDKPLTMEAVRALQLFAAQSATGAGKLVIIPLADRLRVETANALLKLVEEPPDYLSILLLAETTNLLPTLYSRVHQLELSANSATMAEEGSWGQFAHSLDLSNGKQRQLARTMLYTYPLVHSTIRSDQVLETMFLAKKSHP